MTGGTAYAAVINHNLARACHDFGFGMGLGSCRSLLFENTYFDDFNVRKIIGNDLPLYANLGIAQMEELVVTKSLQKAVDLVSRLEADGLIIHVNPFQEWLQPEGDKIRHTPLQTIQTILEQTSLKIIVKEVGQGMGYQSLKALFALPLEAVDFAAYGGTNFAKLELLRGDKPKAHIYEQLAYVGHTAEEMVEMTNQIQVELGENMKCRQVIISGGIKHFLDGYYLIEKINLPAVYGQASEFLKYARGDYQILYDFITTQIQGLRMAKAFLRVK
jgi:isopentenyl-diphosphate delta-isomerase